MTPPLVLSDRVPSGCLARFPEQFAKLRTDPGLARTAFGEAVRYETPVQTFFRTTTRPVEIDGIELCKGEKVLMFLGAANRDPRRWVRPDEYDISRRTIGHVGFGSGIHQCVGSHCHGDMSRANESEANSGLMQ
jgi:cytochrome P450